MTDSTKQIKQTLQKIEETKKIMEDNVEKIILQAELLQKIDVKTKDLRNHTQAFALNSHELNSIARAQNYRLGGIISGAIVGSLYGIFYQYSPVIILLIGAVVGAAGGAAGYYFGEMKGFVGKMIFSYNNRMENTHSINESGAKKAPLSLMKNHHEIESSSLEISKTLTQWFQSRQKPQKGKIEEDSLLLSEDQIPPEPSLKNKF